jgi:hypothetical protein
MIHGCRAPYPTPYQTREAMHLSRNIEACSRNKCGHEKGISITYSECLCSLNYPACKALAPYYKVVQIWPGQTVTCLHTSSPGHIWTTLYIVTCGLSGITICFLIISQTVHKMCVLIFSTTLYFSETFLISRISQRDKVINANMFSCKVPFILVRF